MHWDTVLVHCDTDITTKAIVIELKLYVTLKFDMDVIKVERFIFDDKTFDINPLLLLLLLLLLLHASSILVHRFVCVNFNTTVIHSYRRQFARANDIKQNTITIQFSSVQFSPVRGEHHVVSSRRTSCGTYWQ